MITGIARRLRSQDQESGLGMVLVIGIVVFVAALTATAGTIAINGLGQSRQRIHFEQSLAAAESGVDYALGELQKAFDLSFADFPVPNPGSAPTSACTATTVQLPTAANTPKTWNERAWVDGQLDALEAAPRASGRPLCLLRTPIGDALVLKPLNAAGGPGLKYGRVYARGWSPRWGDPRAVERTIKVEYVFMPYQPQHAVLTGSSLDLQGSYLVDEAQNVLALAGVHTNGSLTVTGNGGNVSGPVTFGQGTAPNVVFSSGPATKLQSTVPIPTVSARQLYAQASTRGSVAPGRWRDLCVVPVGPGAPYGEARDWSANGPCTGTVTDTGGWQFSGSTPEDYLWTANRNAQDGTYFVWKANATNGSGNYDFGSLTVIAAASEPASRYNCPSPRYGGSIIWDHYDVGVPNFSDMWFLADQDLDVHANFDAGSNGANPVAGTYIAGEEINLWTSSSMLVGSVLAANQCDNDMGSLSSQGNNNEIQGQEIWFKPNADSPFSSVISTTLWLEY